MNPSATAAPASRGATRERPLAPAARAALVVAAAATIVLFYATAIGALAILGAIVVVLAGLLLGGARFGLATFMAPLIATPSALFMIIIRRLWLREETAWRITLEPH